MKAKKMKFKFDEKKILDQIKRTESVELRKIIKHNVFKDKTKYSRKFKHKGKDPYV